MRPPEGLNPESTIVAEVIRRLFPDWEDRSDVRWTQSNGWLRIRVPSPCSSDGGDLELDFDCAEVTVLLYGPWHMHLDFDPQSNEFPVHVAQMTRLLDGILEDRLVVINCYQESKWLGSTVGEIGWNGKLTPAAHRRALELGSHQAGSLLRVRSWSGALDIDERLGS